MQKLANVSFCNNDDVDGYICGRDFGHDGKHVAFDKGGMVICEWYDPDIAGMIVIEFINTKVTNV